jgi:excisionase family DNA binding protein
MSVNRYMSTVRASEALGVSVTTIKRWVDEGVLPAHKTAGGHRKILVDDVLRLVRGGRLPYVNLAVLAGGCGEETPTTPMLADRLTTALRQGDRETSRALLATAYRAGVRAACLGDEVVAPALARLGHAWETGRIDIFHEHRATQLCLEALHELRNSMPTPSTPDRPTAVGGSASGDGYVVANQLVELTLMDQGWEAVNIGPNTPAASFRTALHELRPRLLWLSISNLPDPEKFLADYGALCEDARRAEVAVVVGGRALTPEVRARLPYTAFGDSLAHLATFAGTLYPRPKRRERRESATG